MSASTLAAYAAAGNVRAHGEPVTLPSGGEVLGVFEERYAPPLDASEAGAVVRISQQPTPVVLLQDADATDVAEHAVLIIRGQRWRVTHLQRDNGLTRAYLDRARADAAVSPPRRWR